MEGGVIFFDPDSLKEVVGAGAMTHDEYLDVQFQSMGKCVHILKCIILFSQWNLKNRLKG